MNTANKITMSRIFLSIIILIILLFPSQLYKILLTDSPIIAPPLIPPSVIKDTTLLEAATNKWLFWTIRFSKIEFSIDLKKKKMVKKHFCLNLFPNCV